MEIRIKRLHRTANSTISELSIDGKFQCYTLEDVEREKKIKSETAIPKGSYKVIINYSNRFKQNLPLILNVPNFEGVRIHTGNSNHDTEGCILVGKVRGIDYVGKSRVAFTALFDKMKKATNINLTIE